MTAARFDLPVRQRSYLLVVAGVFGLLGTFHVAVGGPPLYWVHFASSALFVAYFFLFARFGTTIDETGVRLRGFTTQQVPWRHIQSIEAYSLLGTTGVKLRLIGGGTKRLRAPVTGFGQDDPEFGAKLATIRHWWQHYTGQPTGVQH